MRNRFERQLLELNNELIQMGSMIERAIEMGISALVRQDVEKAKKAIAYDEEIDEQEKTVESLCMKLLLQQQPVAKDLRLISAALKMITDMERIGDQASDIADITKYLENSELTQHVHIQQMAEAQGIDEDLKARDPMAWVGTMNNIKNAALEILRESK